MPAKKPKFIIVDTNCYVKLYLSPVRPILGSVFAGQKLVTLTELQLECGPGSRVHDRYPFLAAADIQKELSQACLSIREPKKSRIERGVRPLQKLGNKDLAKYCLAKNKLPIREASLADIRMFVTAEELDAQLATDEWPLRYVIEQRGGKDRLCDTVDVVRLMETSGAITAEQRRETVRMWGAYGEVLLEGWEVRYQGFFGEPPPDGQAPRSQSA